MDSTLKLSELLSYAEGETERWRKWFVNNPGALQVKVEIAQAATAESVLQHIVAVDLRYAERLMGEPVTPYEELPTDAASLFNIADEAFAKLNGFLSSANEEDWKTV